MMIPLLLSVLFLTFSASAQQYPIIQLQATGSQRYQPAEIVATSGLKPDIGKPVALAAVRDAAQRLVDSGVFSDVSYQHTAAAGGMNVQFIVKDKPADQFLPAVFENIVWLPDAELRNELHNKLPLFHGEIPLDGRMGDDVAEAVGDLLKQRNIDAHVTSTQWCASTQKNCTRNFTVDNIQIETEQLNVSGAPAEIAAEVQQAAREDIIGKQYLRSRTDRDLARLIRAACLRRGMLQPQISEVAATPSRHSGDGVGVTVSASVVPGPAYRFEGQNWTGNTAIESAQLQKMVHLYQHLPVDGAKLEADLAQVRAQFAFRGYMQARITAQPEFDEAQGAVKYNFVVAQGPLFRMGKIDISGFPDKVVTEVTTLWKLREGDPFDRSYVVRFFADPKIMQMFEGKQFVVEQSEGENEQVVDVSIVLCHPSGCNPSPNALFVSAAPQNDSKPDSK
jgi:outer membrane protein assembly factor BamA